MYVQVAEFQIYICKRTLNIWQYYCFIWLDKLSIHEWSLNQVICFIYKKFLWKDHRGDRKEENGEDESTKRSKCWTVHSWVGRLILINITLENSLVDKKPIEAASYCLGGISSLNLMFSLVMLSFISWNISLECSEVIRNRML